LPSPVLFPCLLAGCKIQLHRKRQLYRRGRGSTADAWFGNAHWHHGSDSGAYLYKPAHWTKAASPTGDGGSSVLINYLL